jgi:hypothetical protein
MQPKCPSWLTLVFACAAGISTETPQVFATVLTILPTSSWASTAAGSMLSCQLQAQIATIRAISGHAPAWFSANLKQLSPASNRVDCCSVTEWLCACRSRGPHLMVLPHCPGLPQMTCTSTRRKFWPALAREGHGGCPWPGKVALLPLMQQLMSRGQRAPST